MNCKFCGIVTKNKTEFCSHKCSTTYFNKHVWSTKKLGKCRLCGISIENKRVFCNECWTNKKCSPTSKTSLTNNKYCSACEIEKSTENTLYLNGKWAKNCRKCDSRNKAERVNKFKKNCVEYKNGKCVVCGYNKYIGALEFHHTDPIQKDFSMAQKKTCKFDDSIKKELDKCAMLCANCHREEHAKLKSGEPSLLTPKLAQEIYVEIC